MRRVVICGLMAGSALLLTYGGLTACGTTPETPFGNPNTLDRKNLPGEGGVELLSCSGDAAVGGFDGGCPSFATDIYPYFTDQGKWKCSTADCHGGASDPPIAGGDPAACRASLAKITVTGLPYIASDGGADPNASSLLCNLQGTCGSKMPKPPGADPTTSELCMIEAWLKCGAPD